MYKSSWEYAMHLSPWALEIRTEIEVEKAFFEQAFGALEETLKKVTITLSNRRSRRPAKHSGLENARKDKRLKKKLIMAQPREHRILRSSNGQVEK